MNESDNPKSSPPAPVVQTQNTAQEPLPAEPGDKHASSQALKGRTGLGRILNAAGYSLYSLHPLSKQAKDMGSAAQLVALTLIFTVWAVILI
nr:diacylglycerol kinase [Rhodoferax ferrireducens]